MNNREKTREILMQLPELCYDFISSVAQRTSELTRLNYVHDLKLFFSFLHEFIQGFEKDPKDYTIHELKLVTPRNIDMFLDHISSYNVIIDDKQIERTNQNAGKKRKITTIRAFYRFLYKRQLIESDVTALVDVPKIKEKAIITLEPEEITRLLDTVRNGSNLPGNGKAWNEKTKSRDLAIFALLLGTGIRISECVGLNLGDVDFKTGMFKVTRKGGNEAILYFSHEIAEYLLDYLQDRKDVKPNPGHEKALFLSSQNNRISVRAVQHFVANYKKAAGIVKKISPHKFRSTYGTRLYQNTGDIYLVADVLGHKDVNTTTKHYAKMSDELRKSAAEKVHLTDDVKDLE